MFEWLYKIIDWYKYINTFLIIVSRLFVDLHIYVIQGSGDMIHQAILCVICANICWVQLGLCFCPLFLFSVGCVILFVQVTYNSQDLQFPWLLFNWVKILNYLHLKVSLNFDKLLKNFILDWGLQQGHITFPWISLRNVYLLLELSYTIKQCCILVWVHFNGVIFSQTSFVIILFVHRCFGTLGTQVK